MKIGEWVNGKRTHWLNDDSGAIDAADTDQTDSKYNKA